MKKIVIALTFVFSFNCFCFAQQQSIAQERKVEAVSSHKARPPQELTELATNAVITYFEKVLIAKNVVNITHLKKLLDVSELINPITKEERYAGDHTVGTVASRLDELIGKYKSFIDFGQVKVWARAKIEELERIEKAQKQVYEETRELHIPMRFAQIPAGKYIDMITGEEFTISEDEKIEIQETPVTQYQWASVMGDNPSTHVETVDLSDIAEEVLINNQFVQNKKIKMRPNASVETLSYDDMQKFIDKLNADAEKSGQDYVYALPSCAEYFALMQAALGQNWLGELKQLRTCQAQNEHANQTGDQKIHTCPVALGDYLDLRQAKKRVWDVVGNVWQWTRDSVEINKCASDTLHYFRQTCDKNEVQTERIMFGGSYTTRGTLFDKTTLFGPVPFNTDRDEDIGFRLVRFPKTIAYRHATKKYNWDQFDWGKESVDRNLRLRWDEIDHRIRFNGWYNMMEHPELYPQETRNTIEELFNFDGLFKFTPVYVDDGRTKHLRRITKVWLADCWIQDLTPLAGLTSLKELVLSINQIQDLKPLVDLTQLEDLCLEENLIQNLMPLVGLTRLKRLKLAENQIQDLPSLANLTQLEDLWLYGNRIQNLMPLAGLTQLTRLFLQKNQICNLTPIAGLTHLQMLYLDKNQIQDITPLAGLTQLTWLKLGYNKISNLMPLAGLTQLVELWLAHNPIQDLAPLAKLTQKLTVYLDQDQMNRLKPQIDGLPNNIKVRISRQ